MPKKVQKKTIKTFTNSCRGGEGGQGAPGPQANFSPCDHVIRVCLLSQSASKKQNQEKIPLHSL